ncbi:MAG: DUF3995 domain-containing protein [Paenibacillus sp.]|nr:DUF3995 domain-containing protein [Paenibacillus sp.]
MMLAFDLMVTLILISLGVLHVYWACGGKFGSQAVIPDRSTEPESPPLFAPGKTVTIMVAILLWGAAYVLTVQSGIISDFVGLNPRIFFYLCSVCSIVFAVRALGDFRYVGWFKTVRGTRFSSMDYIFYTPLCMLLSTVFALSAFGWFHE